MRATWGGVLLIAAALLAGCTAAQHDTAATRPSSAQPGAAFLGTCPHSGARLPTSGLPDVTLACLGAGPDVRLAGLRGPAVLNLWASWCGPCRKEAPELQALHAAAGSRLAVLGVLTDDEAANGIGAARSFGIRYPSVIDQDGAVRRSFGLPGPPATLLVDADGRVVRRILGPVPPLPRLEALVADELRVRI